MVDAQPCDVPVEVPQCRYDGTTRVPRYLKKPRPSKPRGATEGNSVRASFPQAFRPFKKTVVPHFELFTQHVLYHVAGEAAHGTHLAEAHAYAIGPGRAVLSETVQQREMRGVGRDPANTAALLLPTTPA